MPDPLEPSRVAPVSSDPPSTASNPDATEAGAFTADAPPRPKLESPVTPGEVGVFGPYRVLAELGRGGMGVVYLAEELELKRRIALKVMLPSVATDPKAVARFRREAEAQAKVEHDHVTAIYRVGEVNGVPYLAMPLLRGQTLSAALRLNPRPPIAEVVRIAREMSEGLAAAHAVGLIHRDIKPGNVWLEGNKRRVKILDFGLARNTTSAPGDNATVTGTILGTPAYMAPEQARSLPIQRRTDLWSLGVIIYQMTTGRMPFDGGSVFDLLTAVVAQQPQPVAELAPDTPPPLAKLIHQLLAKNPTDRPIGAAAVADALAAIERGLVVAPSVQVFAVSPVPGESDPWSELSTAVTEPGAPATEATEPGSRSIRQKRRNPRWPLLVIVVALAAAVGLTVAAIRKTAPQPKPDVAEQPPPPPVVKPIAKAPDKPPAGDQTDAALWVLKQKGGRNTSAVHVRRTGVPKTEVIRDPANLPTVAFTVVGATLDAVLPEHAADITKVFASLGNLELLQFNGATWTDAQLVFALTAMKGKTIDKLEIWDVTEPLPKTVVALRPVTVAWLQLTTAAVDGVPLAGVGLMPGVKTLRLGTGLTDKALAPFADLTNWPDFLNLQGNASLTDAGIAHMRPKTAARVAHKMTIDLTGTAVTAEGAAALAARLPEATVVWTGGTVGPLAVAARTAALKHILDRGGQITTTGAKSLQQPDLIGELNITYLGLRFGPFRSPGPAAAGSPAWDSMAVGQMKEPLTDADLPALRDVNRTVERLYLVGQKFTDRGYAELLAMPHLAGIDVLEITNCDLGDDAIPAIAARAAVTNLHLSDTKITDAGIKLLRPKCPTLTALRLAGTPLTDAVIPALAAFPLLTELDLKGTNLTADGAKQLAARLPYTLIRGPDGQVIEPTRKWVTRDEAVAALLKRGAQFRVGNAAPVDAPVKLTPVVAVVSLRLASGANEPTVPPSGGWTTKAETGSVTEPFDDADLFVLIAALKLKDLQFAYLHGQKLTDDGMAAFLTLPPARLLKEFDASNSAAGDETATVAAGLPLLERLQMSDSKVTDAGVKAIVAGRPGLQRLRLANTAVTDEAIPHLEKLFALTDIDLKGTKVSEAGAKRLSAALPFTDVRYGDGAVLREVAKPLDRDTAAARLLDRNAEVWVGPTLVTTVAELTVKSTVSVSIRLASGPHPTVATPALKWDAPATNRTVEPFGDAELCQVVSALRASEIGRVQLVGQNVTDDGVATLVATLANQKITLLEVSHCGVGDSALRHLAGFPLLKTLYMNGTSVTDAGVKHLAARAETLDALRLADTKVSDAAIPDLKKLVALTVLDLKGTQVSEKGAKELSAALPKCHIRYGTGTEFVPKK